MILTVSGVTYYGACDPQVTDVPSQEGWPTPTRAKVGKGSRFTYDVTAEQAVQIVTHLEDLAASFAYGDVDTRAEGRAIAQDAARIRRQMQEARS